MSKFREGFTYEELSAFYRKWITMYGPGRDDKDQRLGQSICNGYLRPGASFPELYTEESAFGAFLIAYGELNTQQFQSLPRC